MYLYLYVAHILQMSASIITQNHKRIVIITISAQSSVNQSISAPAPAASTSSTFDTLVPRAAPVCDVCAAVLLPVVPGLVVPVALPVGAADPVPVVVPEMPLVVAGDEVCPAKAKRSDDWKVWQFDEAGMRGVKGGGVTKGSGIDQVDAVMGKRC